jgi:hypothetical protein
MTAKTLEAELAEIETAITAVLTRGQRYQMNGRMYEAADIAELRQMRTDCQNRINSTATMSRTVAEF